MGKSHVRKGGRKNPHYARLGVRGRKQMRQWWDATSGDVRVLPSDVAKAFPSSEEMVEALRLVMKLRAAKAPKRVA